jgi:hypothetical protein
MKLRTHRRERLRTSMPARRNPDHHNLVLGDIAHSVDRASQLPIDRPAHFRAAIGDSNWLL